MLADVPPGGGHGGDQEEIEYLNDGDGRDAGEGEFLGGEQALQVGGVEAEV